MTHRSKKKEKFTYADYRSWLEEERSELIDGFSCTTGPATTRHQRISIELATQIHNYFKNKPCEVFTYPFEVRFPESDEPDDEIISVVLPDIAVICDSDKIDEKGCRGAPDWIIEITSMVTASRDFISKFALYERNGVKEYWIVHPQNKNVAVYRLEPDGGYGELIPYSHSDIVQVSIFPDLSIDLNPVFKKA